MTKLKVVLWADSIDSCTDVLLNDWNEVLWFGISASKVDMLIFGCIWVGCIRGIIPDDTNLV